jgi:short subunit dehydrogenase-like uncharacterized protein
VIVIADTGRTAFRGGGQRGTLASMRRQLEQTRTVLPGEGDLRSIERRRDLGVWLAPFVMAGINTRVVRRSNALEGLAPLPRGLRIPKGPSGLLKATITMVGQRALPGLATSKTAQPLLNRLLPAPGEGLDEDTRRRGRFEMEIHARTTTRRHYVARVSCHGDPGYTASALMIGPSAPCLALDQDQLPARGGVLTRHRDGTHAR